MKIPRNHPRYTALQMRETIADGMEMGLVDRTGLIAHGRGEAFDYLLGERTTESARRAEMAAASALLLAESPVISVNGNTAVLVPDAIKELAEITHAKVEVNIFHRDEERVRRLVSFLEGHGIKSVLGLFPDAQIPGLSHPRGLCCSDGIYSADVVFVPLEDGDRAEALIKMGKAVIAVDLNPLSRTAKTATITIVDNVTRAVPEVAAFARCLSSSLDEAREILVKFDNVENLNSTVEEIISYLECLPR